MYNACEWGNYCRVQDTSKGSRQVGRRAIVSWAALMVAPDSPAYTPQQLANKTIGVPFYFIGGDAPTGLAEAGTDIGALAEGYVSVTPLHLDLTAYRALTDLHTWEWQEQGAVPLFEAAAKEKSVK